MNSYILSGNVLGTHSTAKWIINCFLNEKYYVYNK